MKCPPPGNQVLARVLAGSGAVLALLSTTVLAGCNATMTTVKVPVPVECREEMPTRPAMPTDTLDPAATVDIQNRAMRAEIERRDGYEAELVAALENCRRPLRAP